MPANQCPTISAVPFAARGRSYRICKPVGAGHAREPMPNHQRGPVRGQGPLLQNLPANRHYLPIN